LAADVAPSGGRSARATAGALGIAAPALYAATVLVGGIVTPGYSHLSHAISELTVEGASQRLPLSAAFVLYDLLLVAFALLLPRALSEARQSEAKTGAWILVLVGVAGIGMSTIFPAPAAGDTRIGASGWIHIALAAVASLGSIAAVLITTRSLRSSPGWAGFRRFSSILLAAIVVTGALAVLAVAAHSPLLGLAERATIGGFLAWVLMLGASLLAGVRRFRLRRLPR
jgi:hypothetical membrane protein